MDTALIGLGTAVFTHYARVRETKAGAMSVAIALAIAWLELTSLAAAGKLLVEEQAAMFRG